MSQNFQGFPHFELLGEATLATQLSRFLVVVQVEFESLLAEWWSVHRGRFSGRVVFFSAPPRGGQATVWSWGRFPFGTSPAFIFPGGQSARTFYWRCFSGIWKSKMDVLTLQNQHHGLASDSCDHSLAKEAGNVGCVWASIGGKDLSKRWVAMIWREFPFSKASCLVSIHWLVVRCTIVDRRRTCTCTGDG